MTWAQRLKRVFNIDIQTCPDCQDPGVIHKNLTPLKEKAPAPEPARLPACRAPPPHRFRGTFGSAVAATQAGDTAKAKYYFAKLIQLGAKGDPRPELQQAKTYLAQKN